MPRNTNVDEILFPVEEQRVFLQGYSHPIPGFKAIIGNLGKGIKKIFSIVSDDYKLVKNNEAIQIGKDIHLNLFPKASSDSFEIFNIIVPDSKSFCQIDIVDKNYTLNIWKKEIYIPFIRIHNSYNKSRSLKFEIGFCRKLCDNGVIFEQNTVMLKYAHTKKSIKDKDLIKVDVTHLKNLENLFIQKTKTSLETNLPNKYFVPLAAKVLDRKFNLKEKNSTKLNETKKKLEDFKSQINNYATFYCAKDNFGETAYAFFNVITDYASNNSQVNANSINGLQTKCGSWINQIDDLILKHGFNWDDEIKEYNYLLN